MNCIKCGNEPKEDDIFCGKCGKRVTAPNGRHSNFTGIYGLCLLFCNRFHNKLEQEN